MRVSCHSPNEYSGQSEKIFRAGWVIVSSSKIIRNGYVKTRNGRIVETGVFKPPIKGSQLIADLGPGIIAPGFINCHTHLELSFLKNQLDTTKGFRQWVQDLINARSLASVDVIVDSARKALADLHDSGAAFAGDISSLGLSQEIFSEDFSSGIGFHEFLGGLEKGPYHCHHTSTDRKKFSLAAHAPHTTSPDLMFFLKRKTLNNGLPFSIHLDESDDEREFIKKGKGAWAEFLSSRGIDYSHWPVPSESPVTYVEKIGILDSKTICVHVCGASGDDLEILRKHDARICLCPRSNMNLHGLLPPVEKMISLGIKPCLGTDSLASVDSLSVFDEARFICGMFPGIRPSAIFEMASINGAVSLGMSDTFGTLEAGKTAFLLYTGDYPSSDPGVFESLVLSKNIEVL